MIIDIQAGDIQELDDATKSAWFGQAVIDTDAIRFLNRRKAKEIWRFLRDTDFTFRYENDPPNPWVSASRDRPEYREKFGKWLRDHVSCWSQDYVIVNGMELGALLSMQCFLSVWPYLKLERANDIRIVDFNCTEIVFIDSIGVAKFGRKPHRQQ